MATDPAAAEKTAVREFWDAASCGEVYAEGSTPAEQLATHAATRYRLEPYIADFARFEEGAGRDVLEVGVGMGADHARWAAAGPRRLVGVDLTPRAVTWTTDRLRAEGRVPRVLLGDGERLPFPDRSFDLVYSWGVLHHSPETSVALREVHRVLRPGGVARVMVYHRRSIVGALLWARYALAAGRPRRSMADVYASHLESPGTKAYTLDEARAMLAPFAHVGVRSQLSFADLLEGEVGQQHSGRALAMAKRLWPRRAVERLLSGWGLYLLIEAVRGDG